MQASQNRKEKNSKHCVIPALLILIDICILIKKNIPGGLTALKLGKRILVGGWTIFLYQKPKKAT